MSKLQDELARLLVICEAAIDKDRRWLERCECEDAMTPEVCAALIEFAQSFDKNEIAGFDCGNEYAEYIVDSRRDLAAALCKEEDRGLEGVRDNEECDSAFWKARAETAEATVRRVMCRNGAAWSLATDYLDGGDHADLGADDTMRRIVDALLDPCPETKVNS